MREKRDVEFFADLKSTEVVCVWGTAEILRRQDATSANAIGHVMDKAANMDADGRCKRHFNPKSSWLPSLTGNRRRSVCYFYFLKTIREFYIYSLLLSTWHSTLVLLLCPSRHVSFMIH